MTIIFAYFTILTVSGTASYWIQKLNARKVQRDVMDASLR